MLTSLVLGVLVVVTAPTFPMAWLGLELNLIAFLPWALGLESQKKGAIAYFIAQRLGSLIVLISGLAARLMLCRQVLLLTGLLLKIGLLPLHYWVPTVVHRLSGRGLFLLLRWQKLAPLSIMWSSRLGGRPRAWINAAGGSLLILAATNLPLLLIFRGIVQIGWLLSFTDGYAYYYLSMYFVILALTLSWAEYPRLRLGWALMNAGGLPPITGFVIKLKGLLRLPGRLGGCLLRARGLALCSYSRFVVNSRYQSLQITPSLVLASGLGIV